MEQSKKTIFAQDYMYNSYDGFGMNWWNTNLPSQYKFASSQMVELNEYIIDFDLKIFPLQKELQAQQIEMKKYVNRNNADPEKVKEYLTQISDIQNQITDIRMEARENMNSLFTDEQRGYLNDTSIGWWDDFYGRCGWN